MADFEVIKLSSRLLKYIESVNMGVILMSAELQQIIRSTYKKGHKFEDALKDIINRVNGPLNDYLDVLFDLQTLATFVELASLPNEMQEDAAKMVEEERQAYIKRVHEINEQLNNGNIRDIQEQ